MTSSPTSSPDETIPTTPAEAETPVAEGPRPRRGRPGVPRVSSLFAGGEDPSPSRPEGPQLEGPGGSGTGSLLDGPSAPSEDGPELGSSGRSRSSKPRQPGSAATRRKMRLAARKSLVGFSHIAHGNLARDDLDEFANVYVMSDDQAKLIADPLANIGARRIELAGVAGNPDLADALAAIVGFAVYVLDQLAIRSEVRKV